MRRLTAKNVFSGLVTAWRLAGWPVSRSPSSVKATIDGVVRIPSAFSMTFGVLPSITATQELVVPRSIPMTLPMVFPLFAAGRTGLFSAPKGASDQSGSPRFDPSEYAQPAALGGPNGSYRRVPCACKTGEREFAAVNDRTTL